MLYHMYIWRESEAHRMKRRSWSATLASVFMCNALREHSRGVSITHSARSA